MIFKYKCEACGAVSDDATVGNKCCNDSSVKLVINGIKQKKVTNILQKAVKNDTKTIQKPSHLIVPNQEDVFKRLKVIIDGHAKR